MEETELKAKVLARIKSNGIRSKFAIYEDVKQMLRGMNLSANSYEYAIRTAVNDLKI